MDSAAKDRENTLAVLYYHVHLLSDQGSYGKFAMVSPDVIRIDLRDYGWDRNNKLVVWEQAQKIDYVFTAKIEYLEDAVARVYWPGGTDPKDKKFYAKGSYRTRFKKDSKAFTYAPNIAAADAEGLRKILYTEVPILNAEWFFVQTARQLSISNEVTGFGYYDFLGIKDRQDFFDLVGLDEKKAVKLLAEHRAVVVDSGVSQQNRQTVTLGGTTGPVHGTLDTFVQRGRGIARLNLRRGEFKHNAEEWYGHNPLGLPITIANDDKGVLASTVPDKIGPAKSPLVVGKDTRIHPNLCMVCHGLAKNDHLMTIDDWTRKAFTQGEAALLDKNKKVQLELQSQYLRDLKSEIEDDRRKYARAVALVTRSKKFPAGMTTAQITKLYMELWNREVESPFTVADVARKLGTTEVKFTTNLKRYQITKGRTENIFLDLLKPKGTLPRLDFEESYQFMSTIAAGLSPAELPQKRKVKP